MLTVQCIISQRNLRACLRRSGLDSLEYCTRAHANDRLTCYCVESTWCATLLSAILMKATALITTARSICSAPAARANTIPFTSYGIDPLMVSSPVGSCTGFPFRPTRLKSEWGTAASAAAICAQLLCCCGCCCCWPRGYCGGACIGIHCCCQGCSAGPWGWA